MVGVVKSSNTFSTSAQQYRTAEYAANQNNNVSDQHSRPHSSTGLVRERRIKKKIELLFKKKKKKQNFYQTRQITKYPYLSPVTQSPDAPPNSEGKKRKEKNLRNFTREKERGGAHTCEDIRIWLWLP